MKRFATMVLLGALVLSLATTVQAERDRIPGIGTTGAPESGTMEWGDIGGIKPKVQPTDLKPIHVEEEPPIWKW